jgi:hypothetical protein
VCRSLLESSTEPRMTRVDMDVFVISGHISGSNPVRK